MAEGADPNDSSENGLLPLNVAAKRNRLDVVKLLLDAGADVNAIPPMPGSGTVLSDVLPKSNSVEVFKTLLKAGAEANECATVGKRSHSLLGMAVNKSARAFDANNYDEADQYLEKVDALLDHGANVHKVEKCTQLPVMALAISTQCHIALIDRLQEAGAIIAGPQLATISQMPSCLPVLQRTVNGLMAEDLQKAAITIDGAVKRNPEAVPILLDAGLSPDGDAALEAAVSSNRPELVQMLLKRGADVNRFQNTLGIGSPTTPLMKAVSTDNALELVSLLLEAGADPNTPDDGTAAPPLMIAISHKDAPALVRLLLANGAKVNGEDKSGQTALFRALFTPSAKELISLLIEADADVNKQDSRGRTPLMRAMCDSPDHPALPVLLDAGADPSITDEEGLTAEMIFEQGRCRTS
ncbi:ankyrin repeat domain-containing protein [Allohahella sp. A8]|uniref:ankyrin repeat domain-containing protein n=1 Tax=Allohahella sp. A8 TaxID=3141461 RepID=UPI003A804885